MTPQEREWSLVAQGVDAAPSRSLGIALAQCMVLTPITAQHRHALFAKVYRDSPPATQLECRAEMQAMREARRGDAEARVSWPSNVVRIDG